MPKTMMYGRIGQFLKIIFEKIEHETGVSLYEKRPLSTKGRFFIYDELSPGDYRLSPNFTYQKALRLSDFRGCCG